MASQIWIKRLGLKVTFYLFMILMVAACKKGKSDPVDPGNSQDVLKDNAAHNNKVLEGAGNLFLESNLTPNSPSQLIALQSFNTDSIAYYGSVNSAGQLNKLNAIVVSWADGTKQLVTQILAQENASLVYMINKNVRSRYVIKTIKHNSEDKELQVLDYNWATNDYKVVESNYYRADTVLAKSTQGLNKLQTDMDNPCTDAPSTGDLSKDLDDDLFLFSCTGLHPVTTSLATIVEQAANKIINAGADLRETEEKYRGFSQKIPSIGAVFNKLSAIIKKLTSPLKRAENNYIPAMKDIKIFSLIPFAEGSITDYDEALYDHVELAFTVVHESRPFLEHPVYVDLALFIPGTTRSIFRKTLASSVVDGKLTFKFNPLTMEGYSNITALEARYKFSQGVTVQKQNITLKYILPTTIQQVSGGGQTFEANKALISPLVVKITDKDGKAAPFVKVNWTVTKGDAKISKAQSSSDEQGFAQITVTAGSATSLEVTASGVNVNGALLSGAPVKFTATKTNPWVAKLIGEWKATSYEVYTASMYNGILQVYNDRFRNGYTGSVYTYTPIGDNTIEMQSYDMVTMNANMTSYTRNYHWQEGFGTNNHSSTWSVDDSGYLKMGSSYMGPITESTASRFKVTLDKSYSNGMVQQYIIFTK